MKTRGTQFIASVALCWSHMGKRNHGETRFSDATSASLPHLRKATVIRRSGLGEGRVCSVRKAKVRDCHNGIIATRVVLQPAAVCRIVVSGA